MFKTQFFLLTQYKYLDPPKIHSWFSRDDLRCHFRSLSETTTVATIKWRFEVVVFDFNLTFIFKTPDVRLRSGTLVSEGRVEVRLRDSWGTICDDHWTLREANVVCRSLGYGSAAIAAKNAYFGRGIGQVNQSSVE